MEKIQTKNGQKKNQIKTINNNKKEIKMTKQESIIHQFQSKDIKISELRKLKLKDLKEYWEVNVIADCNKNAQDYKWLQKFENVEMSFYSNTKFNCINVRAMLFQNLNTDDLGWHDKYQLQLEKELRKLSYIKIWRKARGFSKKLAEKINKKMNEEMSLMLKNENLENNNIKLHGTNIGFVGFEMYLYGTHYNDILNFLAKFFEDLDQIVKIKIGHKI
jgi:hypothetical protein